MRWRVKVAQAAIESGAEEEREEDFGDEDAGEEEGPTLVRTKSAV